MRYPLKRTTQILKFFLLVDLLSWLLLAVLHGSKIYFFLTVLGGGKIYSFTIDGQTYDIRQGDFYQNVQWGQMVVHILMLFIFVVWIYRATFNMQRYFGQQSISAGWAAGWNFIPFANFVMVYRAMSNLWAHFSPKPLRYGFLRLWWLLYLAVILSDVICEAVGAVIVSFDEKLLLLDAIKIFIFAGYCLTNMMQMRVVRVIVRGEAQAGRAIASIFA